MIPLRIGIIGAGGMGSFHARTLARIPGVAVAVIADPFEEAAAPLAEELDATATQDALTLAGSGALDGLVIASPDDTHAELALAALDAGTPTLCEKPLATSIADATAIVEFEVKQGERMLQLGFMREYDLAHRQVVEAISQFGPVHAMRCVHLNTNSDARPLEMIVGQSIVHDIHSVRYISGSEITAVTASATTRPDGTYRHIVALCELAGGGHATLEFDDAGFAYDVSVEVTSESGSAITGPEIRAVRRTDGDRSTHVGRDWFGRFADAYRAQDEAWIDGLREGTTSGPSSWDGLVAQAVVEATVASIMSGQRTTIALPSQPDLFA